MPLSVGEVSFDGWWDVVPRALTIRELLGSSGSRLVPVEERSQMIFVGVDWAVAHHDVHVEDEEGRRLAGGRLPEAVEEIARFHELVGAHVEEPSEVIIGIETDRGLVVAALVAAGYSVFAVNPMSTSRYRDRHSSSGPKSDSGDAEVLADMVRIDRHNHRLVAGDSEVVEAVKVLARAHQSMIWSRGRQTNALRSIGAKVVLTAMI